MVQNGRRNGNKISSQKKREEKRKKRSPLSSKGKGTDLKKKKIILFERMDNHTRGLFDESRYILINILENGTKRIRRRFFSV